MHVVCMTSLHIPAETISRVYVLGGVHLSTTVARTFLLKAVSSRIRGTVFLLFSSSWEGPLLKRSRFLLSADALFWHRFPCLYPFSLSPHLYFVLAPVTMFVLFPGPRSYFSFGINL